VREVPFAPQVCHPNPRETRMSSRYVTDPRAADRARKRAGVAPLKTKVKRERERERERGGKKKEKDERREKEKLPRGSARARGLHKQRCSARSRWRDLAARGSAAAGSLSLSLYPRGKSTSRRINLDRPVPVRHRNGVAGLNPRAARILFSPSCVLVPRLFSDFLCSLPAHVPRLRSPSPPLAPLRRDFDSRHRKIAPSALPLSLHSSLPPPLDDFPERAQTRARV